MATPAPQTVPAGAAWSVQGAAFGQQRLAETTTGSIRCSDIVNGYDYRGQYVTVQSYGADAKVWFHNDSTSSAQSDDSTVWEDQIPMVVTDGAREPAVIPYYKTGDTYLHYEVLGAGTTDIFVNLG